MSLGEVGRGLRVAVLAAATSVLAVHAAEPKATMAYERCGRRVAAFERAQSTLAACRVNASPSNAVHGFDVPFIAPGGAYGSNWWQLDLSVALEGLKWYDPVDAARMLDGFARVMREDGRIPLWGNDRIPKRKGWFSEQHDGISSLPAFFRPAHDVAIWLGDRAFAERMLSLMARYLNWWMKNRVDAKTGLVSAVFEETFPPWLGFAGEYAAPDTCAEVALGAELTADLAQRLGKAAQSEQLRESARRLYAAARKSLLDGERHVFRPLILASGKFAPATAGGFSLLRDPELPEPVRQAVRDAMLGPRFRRGSYGLTTLAVDEPGFKITRSAKYCGNDSWSGMVWTTMNRRAIEGLRAAGFQADAEKLSTRTLEMLEAEDDFYEFYDPADGKGCGVRGYAWTAADYLQLTLHERLGIVYDGFARKVEVRPRTKDDFRVTGLVLPGLGTACILQTNGVTRVALSAGKAFFSPGAPVQGGACRSDGGNLASGNREPDTKELLQTYVRRFNARDDELYANAVPNAAAADFMLANCPRFACPDTDIERTYYFRWWTFRKHLRHDLGVWTISEFLPKVSWSGAGNTIVCPAGHHLREGRWLREAKYATENARFWLADPRATHRWKYSSWLFTGACGVAEVTGDDRLPAELLDDAVAYYRRWEKGFDRRVWPAKGTVRMGGDGQGGFLSVDGHEGTEISLGGHGYKPLFASAMWSEAIQISNVARSVGRVELAAEFAAKAETNRQSILRHCWNDDLKFFITQNLPPPSSTPQPSTSNLQPHSPVRELHGYAPWYFGMPTEGRPADWAQLSDAQGFAARYGLTFCERRAPGFTIDYKGHECKWNGPSWPFATSIALTALANDLHAHSSTSTSPSTSLSSLFTSLLRQYAASQRRTHPMPSQEKGTDSDRDVVPWIDENLHPDKPEWLSRQIILDTPEMRKRFPRERGKDYNHSTFCDLVISGLVGFVPKGKEGFAVDPLFPATWDYLVLENLRYRGHDIDIRWRRGDGLRVFVDGRQIASRDTLGKLDCARGFAVIQAN